LQLQRAAGNSAVARLLGGQRSRIALQRSKESEELLTKLATPKVGEGQAIGVQTELVAALEELITEKDWRRVTPTRRERSLPTSPLVAS